MASPKRWLRFFLCGLCLPFMLFCNAIEAEEKIDFPPSSNPYLLSVTLDSGLLTFAADRAPLFAALKALSEKTGAAFYLQSSSFAADLLSVSFRELTFPEALERVLSGYSYVLEGGGDSGPTTVFLLSPQDSKPFTGTAVNDGRFIGPASAPSAPKFSSAPPPPTLEECRNLLPLPAIPPLPIRIAFPWIPHRTNTREGSGSPTGWLSKGRRLSVSRK